MLFIFKILDKYNNFKKNGYGYKLSKSNEKAKDKII